MREHLFVVGQKTTIAKIGQHWPTAEVQEELLLLGK